MEWISKFFEAAKLPTKSIVIIFLTSIFLLISPLKIISTLHLNLIIKQYGNYIGIVSIFTGMLLTVELILWINKKIRIAYLRHKHIKISIERLKQLDQAEKSVLREFFIQGQNTIKLPMDNSVVAGLLDTGILSPVGQHGRHSLAGMLISMKIPDILRNRLTNQMLDLPLGKPSESDIKFLLTNRPSFSQSIERENSLLHY